MDFLADGINTKCALQSCLRQATYFTIQTVNYNYCPFWRRPGLRSAPAGGDAPSAGWRSLRTPGSEFRLEIQRSPSVSNEYTNGWPLNALIRAMKILILGLGNPILRDDSVGLRVAQEVERLIPANPDVEVGLDYWGGLRLMERMIGFDRAIIIDAICTGA